MKTPVLIIGFDGLRPDAVTPERMPNLSRFMSAWCVCQGHRAVFPTETYVNHPTIYSGAYPGRHGIIANMYYNRPGTVQTPFFDGSRVDSIEANDAGQSLFQVRTMGEILGDAGMTMRVIGSNSAGSTRLKHHTAHRYPGHLNLPMRDISCTIPQQEKNSWQLRLGEGYPLTLPDLSGSLAVVDSFFQVEVPRGLADVTVLWIGEPDHSCHYDGVDGATTVEAQHQADALFGKIVDWWEQQGQEVQLVVLSDHGHVTVERHSNLRGTLACAGLRVIDHADIEAGASPEDADFVIAGAYCGGLWPTRPDQEVLNRALETLLGYNETGMLFCPEPKNGTLPEGIFPESLVLSAHSRSPDIRFITKGDPERGVIAMESGLPIGGGAHGGLLPQELSSLCVFAGSRFKTSWQNTLPSGPADIAATVLSLLGFNGSTTDALDGRILSECMAEHESRVDTPPKKETFTAEHGNFRQVLESTLYQGRVYLDKGYRF